MTKEEMEIFRQFMTTDLKIKEIIENDGYKNNGIDNSYFYRDGNFEDANFFTDLDNIYFFDNNDKLIFSHKFYCFNNPEITIEVLKIESKIKDFKIWLESQFNNNLSEFNEKLIKSSEMLGYDILPAYQRKLKLKELLDVI